jgi:EpsI family protein
MTNRFRSLISWHLAGTFLLLATTLAASRLAAYRRPGLLIKPLASVDYRISGFTGTDNPRLSEGVLAKLLPTSYLSREYRKPEMQADLFVAFYAQQRAGESMHSPKHCLPGSGWEIWNYGSAEIPVNGRNFKVNQYSIGREGKRMLVLYWYQSKNRIIASEYWGKVLLARDALLQNSTAASIVRVIVPDQPGALEEARSFASELIPQIQRCFGN